MAAFDRFDGPEAWDAYCEEQDSAYAAIAREKTCLDCRWCVKPDDSRYENILGFCLGVEDFVYADSTISELGYECFEGEVV